jgi:hypothetical protein
MHFDSNKGKGFMTHSHFPGKKSPGIGVDQQIWRFTANQQVSIREHSLYKGAFATFVAGNLRRGRQGSCFTTPGRRKSMRCRSNYRWPVWKKCGVNFASCARRNHRWPAFSIILGKVLLGIWNWCSKLERKVCSSAWPVSWTLNRHVCLLSSFRRSRPPHESR